MVGEDARQEKEMTKQGGGAGYNIFCWLSWKVLGGEP